MTFIHSTPQEEPLDEKYYRQLRELEETKQRIHVERARICAQLRRFSDILRPSLVPDPVQQSSGVKLASSSPELKQGAVVMYNGKKYYCSLFRRHAKAPYGWQLRLARNGFTLKSSDAPAIAEDDAVLLDWIKNNKARFTGEVLTKFTRHGGTLVPRKKKWATLNEFMQKSEEANATVQQA